MRKIVLFAVLACSLAVSACNTVAGAGKDVSDAGHAVTNTADDAKNYIVQTGIPRTPSRERRGFLMRVEL